MRAANNVWRDDEGQAGTR